ncbi:MAG: Ig-like domain-containing protein [Sulfurimonas sp.]|uniref:Ig-like domain-containing protein n=1 Tax=Sulfurimonas sp. TaxID=2022749 RepID=UPI0028CD3A42|nr:Ig-like domain-containing protein [Sulfurimonas sp.]MDT8338592.1 Ig-like domain-containing protein [Sulfurimonas sp.]
MTAFENGGFVITWADNYESTKIKRFDVNGNALMVADEFSNDLVITLKDYPNDEIVIKDLKAQHMVESFVFADGSTISIKELDSVIGVDGLNGSTLLESDEIIGTDAADQLIGGIGDDYLAGGKGADTYLFNRGDGHDTIYEYSNGGVDTLLFGEGIVKEDLVFKNIGGNLIIGLKEDGKNFEELNDTIEIAYAFDMSNEIEKFVFANGEEIAFNDLEAYGAFDGNDQIRGTAVADTIKAGAGNDTINGNSGNDVIAGGIGNDTIDGGEGNDVYIYNRGDGQDIINYYYNTQYTNYYAGADRIKFGDGITKNDIIASYSGSSYILAINEEGKTFDELSDKIVLTNWNSSRGVVALEFTDGTTFDYTDMLSLQSGTEKDDVINLSSVRYGVNIDAKSGNDTVMGTNYDDIINGGSGNDTLYGQNGNDTYFFGRGDGRDTIIEGSESNSFDVLRFKEGITVDDIIIKQNGYDFIIGLKEDGKIFTELSDKITIQNGAYYYEYYGRDYTYSSSYDYRVEKFEFADGTEWSFADIVVHTHSDENDVIHGFNSSDTLAGGKGDDILKGYGGDDTYIFNRGDGKDVIYDSYYRDNYDGGNDTLKLGEGIGAEDIIIQKSGMDLIVAIKEDGVEFDALTDKITLQNWYQPNNRIEHLLLNDGSAIDLSYLLNPTQGDDYLLYGSEDNSVDALGGDDEIYTNDGDDTLIGGTGNDILHGGYGDDTYVFNRGDSYDVINDFGSNSEDIIQFGDGITIDDIIVEVQEGNLLVALKEEGKSFEELSDKIRILGWESSYYSKAVETIKFADGTTYNIAEYFNLPQSQNYYGEAAPIVFDLNSNGITSTSTQSNNVYFDYNADGLRERTGWAERGDGLLAVDVNSDGIINDGSELFGDYTKLPDGSTAADGYAAMQLYDSNNDGRIDSLDANFNDLLLWNDTNLDGQSSTDELSTLTANGIVSIALLPNPLSVTENGNRISYETTYTKSDGTDGIVRDLWFETLSDDTIQSTDGEIADAGSFSDSFDDFTTETTLEIDSIKSMEDSGIDSLTLQSRYTGSGLDGASAQTVFEGVGYTGMLSNVWLKSDTLDTQYTYNGTLSDDIKALPSIDGQGNVINLQEAMNEKSDLALSVSEFQNLSETGNLADFEANIDAIIEEWALYDFGGESANATPPIVLDLDGDGVTSTSLSASNAYFDYDGDGRREHTAWSDLGDALLAVDLDNDGVITHGAELFGNYTIKADGTNATDGYDAMAQYDTNGDNVLDSSDEKFSTLRLWIDANQNGKNDARELSTLAENGINAINLSRADGTTFTQITEAGNIITNETNYIDTSGDGIVRDVWFSYDGTDTIAYSNLSDSDEKKIAIVENFYGKRLNSEERNSVEVIAEVLNQYNALRYDTIAKIITDKLYGEGFPNCTFLHNALNNTLGRVVGGAASATETLLSVNLLASLLKREHVSVLADIYPEYFSNPTISGLLAQSNIAIGFEGGALVGHIGNRYFGTSSAETLDFSALDGVRAYMSGGDDTIIGTEGIDEIVGGEGNDILDGKSGNDVLVGGQGDDILIGASAQNVYRYAWGDGVDTIIDAGSGEYTPDTLRFSDLDISRISIKRVADDMIIHIHDEVGELLTPFGEAFGSITIKDGYTSGKIEHFYFKDTRYTMEEALAYANADTNYYFVKGDGDVLIDEKGGEDTLHFDEGITQENIIARIVGEDLVIALTQEGHTFDTASDKITILNYSNAIEHFVFDNGGTMDLLGMVDFAQAHLKIIGSDESETLYGTAESEIFDGGLGDDTIYGEDGDDIYRFGLGDGKDRVIDSGGADQIIFKAGINASNVSLTLDGEDLLISLEDGSTLRAVSWLASENRIESITDAEGISVDYSNILKPTLGDLSAQTDEDTAIEGSLSVTDISQTDLIYAVVSDTSNGIFTIDEQTGEWGYMPNPNFHGSDSIVVSVTNGYGAISSSMITLNIASVNDAPTIEGEDIVVTLRNTLTDDGQIIANDIDGDTLVYAIETQASHGELSVDENGRWSYTTVDGYDGQDSAIIRVSDGNGGSVERALHFTIIDNTAPEAALETSHTLQDIRFLSGNIGASDADGDALSYTIATDVANGTLSVDANGSWSYAAADGYMGEDIAVITVDDMNGGVIIQTLNFNIDVSAPSLANTTANLFEDTSSTGMLDVVNPIGGVLTYEILNTTTKGEFSVNESGEWSYTPFANINGNDSVTIKVTNTYGLSTTAVLELAIEAVNDTPITTEQENYTLQDIRQQRGQVEATDEDGDVLTYSVTTAALHGTVNVDETGTWIYSVEDTYIGTDSAVITVDDGEGGSVTKTLNFDAKVSAPSIGTVTFNLLEDNLSTNNLNVNNPVGGALTYEIITTSENGTFTLDENGDYSYNPSQDYNGSDAVIVKVTNEYGLSTTSTLTFDVEAVNDAPVTVATEAFILQDVREQTGEVEATDVDGDVLAFSVTTAAEHGTVTIDETGAWTYSVNGIYMGTDSAVITVDDGNGGTATKTLTFDAKVTTPTLTDSTSNLLEDNPSEGIFNVVNPIGGVLTYEVLTATANGGFSVDTDGGWNYNPSQDYNGSDSVVVKVTNEYGLSTTSTLTFDIEAVNDAPIVALESEAFTLTNIRDLEGKVEASDVDEDVLTYTVATQASNGVVTIDSEGNWHYKADGSFNGTDSATILINDGAGGTVTSRLDFTVEGYIYEGGDLVITDNGEDTLVMNEISQTSLSFAKDGNNMMISVKDQGLITITDYFINVDSGVQTITTANGDINLGKDIIKNADESWWRGRIEADEDMKNLIIGNKHRDYLIGSNNSDILFSGDNNDKLQGLGGDDLLIAGKRNDRLYGGDGNDTVYGESGNDKLYGEAGNDMLIGGSGNDIIFGGDGNDFLFGGLGSDNLEGALGDDTYFFEIGNQKSTIDDYEGNGKGKGRKSEDAGYDIVKFGEGIYKEDISFIMKHGDLFFQYGDKDTIEIKNQDEISRQIEKFELADGSFLTNEDVDMVIQQLNAYSTDKKGMHKIDNETIRNNTEMMNIVSSAWQA